MCGLYQTINYATLQPDYIFTPVIEQIMLITTGQGLISIAKKCGFHELLLDGCLVFYKSRNEFIIHWRTSNVEWIELVNKKL